MSLFNHRTIINHLIVIEVLYIYIYRERERERVYSVAGHIIAYSIARPTNRSITPIWPPPVEALMAYSSINYR